MLSHLVRGKALKILFLMETKKNGKRDEKYPSRLTIQCNASSPLLGKKGWFNNAMERRRSEFSYPNLYPEPY